MGRNNAPVAIMAIVTLGIFACGKEPEPRSVLDFLDDPIGLEGTLSRCNANRSLTRLEPECINAREAAKRIASVEEQERQRRLESQSNRKLEAARRRNEARDARLRRAEEEAERVEALRYEQQFEDARNEASGVTDAPLATDAGDPGQARAVEPAPAPEEIDNLPESGDQVPATVVTDPPETTMPQEPEVKDLSDLREELQRRNQVEPEPPTETTEQ